MRSLLQATINALLSADADAVVGAEWGRPSPTRSAQRNGYRHRDLDTRPSSEAILAISEVISHSSVDEAVNRVVMCSARRRLRRTARSAM